jgi:hypothetical protein
MFAGILPVNRRTDTPMASAVVGDRRRAVRGSGVKHDVGR